MKERIFENKNVCNKEIQRMFKKARKKEKIRRLLKIEKPYLIYSGDRK